MNYNNKTVLLIEGLEEKLSILNEFQLEYKISKPPFGVKTWTDVELVVRTTSAFESFLREMIQSKDGLRNFYLYVDDKKDKLKTRERLIAELFKPFDNTLHSLIADTKITLTGVLEQYALNLQDEDCFTTLNIKVYDIIF